MAKNNLPNDWFSEKNLALWEWELAADELKELEAKREGLSEGALEILEEVIEKKRIEIRELISKYQSLQ
jgi:hypothetical protein